MCWGSSGWSIIGDVQVAAIVPVCAKGCCYGDFFAMLRSVCPSYNNWNGFENIFLLFYVFFFMFFFGLDPFRHFRRQLIARALRQGAASGQPRTSEGPGRAVKADAGPTQVDLLAVTGSRAIFSRAAMPRSNAQTPDGCSVRRGGCGGHSHATGPGTNRCNVQLRGR